MKNPFHFILYPFVQADGVTVELHASSLTEVMPNFCEIFMGPAQEAVVEHLAHFFAWTKEIVPEGEVEILIYDRALLATMLGQQGTGERFILEGTCDFESWMIGVRNGLPPTETRRNLNKMVFGAKPDSERVLLGLVHRYRVLTT